jgi:hypothetical protein
MMKIIYFLFLFYCAYCLEYVFPEIGINKTNRLIVYPNEYTHPSDVLFLRLCNDSSLVANHDMGSTFVVYFNNTVCPFLEYHVKNIFRFTSPEIINITIDINNKYMNLTGIVHYDNIDIAIDTMIIIGFIALAVIKIIFIALIIIYSIKCAFFIIEKCRRYERLE